MLHKSREYRRAPMFKNSKNDDRANKYIREKIRQARTEAKESQEELARILNKSRVTISDMERGRVAVSASDLALIASALNKPISYFFPPMFSYNDEEFTPLEEELLSLFNILPETQQLIALEYVKQQVQIFKIVQDRKNIDQLLKDE